jgi:acyl-CoA thioesterase superfamily protein
MRPVPVAPLTIETELLREGRKIQLVSVRLLASGTEVARATVLRVRRLEQVLPVEAPWPPIDIKSPEESHDPTESGLSHTPFLSSRGDAGGQGFVPQARPGGGMVSRDATDRRRRAVVAPDARRRRRRAAGRPRRLFRPRRAERAVREALS